MLAMCVESMNATACFRFAIEAPFNVKHKYFYLDKLNLRFQNELRFLRDNKYVIVVIDGYYYGYHILKNING